MMPTGWESSMYIRTQDQHLHDQHLSTNNRLAVTSTQTRDVRRAPKIYPLRIIARIFTIIGMATAVYATALVGLFFQSGIIAL